MRPLYQSKTYYAVTFDGDGRSDRASIQESSCRSTTDAQIVRPYKGLHVKRRLSLDKKQAHTQSDVYSRCEPAHALDRRLSRARDLMG